MLSRSGNQNQIEAIFGECSDVLNSLLDYLNKYNNDIKGKNLTKNEQLNTVLDKVLEIAEFILRDSKYKKHIENSSKILNDFLNLIEKVENNESKVIIIKTMILIAENNDIKMEFAQKDGFKKLLSLLMNKEEKVYQVISKALLHFLSTEPVEITPLTEEQEKLSSISSKIMKIMTDFRKFTMSEIQRSLNTETQGIPKALDKIANDKKLEEKEKKNMEMQLPSYAMIFEFDLLLLLKEMNESIEKEEVLEEGLINLKEKLGESDEKYKIDELLKEFMISQGGFKSILNALSEAKAQIQLEFLSMLIRLLAHNNKNKLEFKKLNGYYFLSEIFKKELDFNLVENIEFLLSAFDLLELMICENKSDIIINYDAFHVLLILISTSNSFFIISKSLDLLKFLLLKTWKNIIIASRHKIIDHIIALLLRILGINKFSKDSALSQILTLSENILIPLDFHLENNIILEKIDTLIRIISFTNGVYNLDTELYYSEIALSALQNDLFSDNYCLESFFELVNSKKSRKCARVFMLEYKCDRLVRSFAEIFQILLVETLKPERKINIEKNLEKMLEIIHGFIICDHKGDILEEATNNAFLDLLFEKELNEINNKNISRKSLENKLICKNLCVEVKEIIKIFLKEKIQSVHDFDFLFKLLREENETSLTLNNTVLQLFISILLLDEYFLHLFSKLDLFSLISYLMTYNSFEGNSLNVSFSLIFDLLFGKVNSISRLTCFSRKSLEIAQIDPKKTGFISILGFLLLESELVEENSILLEQLLNFLYNAENFKIFNNNLGFIYILEILQRVESQNTGLYASALSLFEFFLDKLSGEDLELYFAYFFNTNTLKKSEKTDLMINIDTLSVLGIHIMFNTNPNLYDKIVGLELFYGLLCFLNCMNHSLKEMTLKFVTVLHLQSMKRKNQLFSKNKFFPLIQKLLTSTPNPSAEICQTLYHLISWNGEKISLLYPPNSSAVSSIINRGIVADLIIKTSKSDAEKQAPPSLVNLEFLEIFLSVLKNNQDENFKYEMLRMLDLNLSDLNCDKLLDSNFLLWCQYFCKGPEMSKVESQLHQILTKLFLYDIFKVKNSKFTENFRKISEDDQFIILIIRNLIIKLCENPILKPQENHSIFLKNLTNLFMSIEELIGTNPDLSILIMQCINILSSKNSGDLRSQMKALGLFDMRDNLLMQILRFEIKNERFLKILEGFSFESLANQSKFKESHSLAYLLKILTDKQSLFSLQLLVVNILKNDLSSNDENQKYIAKLLENQKLILFFYPNYNKNRLSGVAKCFNSINPFNDIEDPNSFSEDEELLEKNKEKYRLFPGMSNEVFVETWNSEYWDYERKQVQLRIERILIPNMTEINKYENRIQQKIINRKTKANEENAKEKVKIQKIVNETELKMSQKLMKSFEKYKVKHGKTDEYIENKLKDGELLLLKIKKEEVIFEEKH